MKSAYAKDVVRSIRHSLGRFIAIAIIAALGSGFYAGLRMTGPDMYLAADEYYDATNAYDIRALGTLGLDDDSIAYLASLEGVEAVCPEREVDVLCSIGGVQYVARIQELDVEAAKASDTSDGLHAISDDPSYITRALLIEGEWPTAKNECLLSYDAVLESDIEVGDKIAVSTVSGADEVSDVLATSEFTVTGFARSPNFPTAASLGNTTLGRGTVDDFLLVPPSAFDKDYPYTGAYITVAGARELISGRDDYKALVAQVAERVEKAGEAISKKRYQTVVGDAQDELDDAWDEYREKRADAEKELADAREKLDDALAELADARKKIASGQDEYDDSVKKLVDAENKLVDAQRQYDDGAAQLADARATAERELANGQAQIDEGRAELEEGLARLPELRDGLRQLDEGIASGEATKADLERQLAEVDATIAQLEDQIPQLEQKQAGLEATIAQLEQKQAEVAGQIAQLEQKKAEAEGAIAYLETQKADLELQIARLEQLDQSDPQVAAALARARATLAQVSGKLAQAEAGLLEIEGYLADARVGQSQIEDGLAQARDGLAQVTAGLAQARAGLAQAKDGKAQLESGIAQADAGLESARQQRAEVVAAIGQIEKGKADLDKAQTELDEQRASAMARLDSEQAKLDDARKQIASGRADIDKGYRELASGKTTLDDAIDQYESGLEEYDDGEAEYADGRKEADEEFADAEKELADAQAEIDDIRNPDWYTLDRTKNIGMESYRSDSDRIDSIAQVFPFIFFLVAALVSLTTMTRMVDEERILIGTYKALGYSNFKIIGKYLVYAASAGILGSIVGILALTQFLPYFIMNAYAIMYQVPCTPTPIDPVLAFGSFALIMAIVLLATWWAAAASLREKPAELMLPRAPKPGKRILLERIKPIWTHLSFSWKVTSRNIFRYKRRLSMVVIGIAGCTALLLTGFGLSNSINDIIDKQFGDDVIIRYNLTVRTEDDVTAAGLASIAKAIEANPDVVDYIPVQIENMEATANIDGGAPEHRTNVIVPRDADRFADFVAMHPRGHADEPIALGEAEVVLSEKLAHELGVGVGDTFRLYEEDSIGNAVGKPFLFKVGGVTENYVNNYVYLSPAAYTQVMGEPAIYDAFLAKSAPGVSAAESSLVPELLARDDIATVSNMEDAISYYRKALKSVDAVVYVLIVAAAALAFVVVYNLTNINISEREREIASLKVLGFRRAEYISYIFRETIILSMLGGLLGLFLGIFLEAFVITTAEVDLVMFGRDIHLWSFLAAFALTMVFTVIVMFFMRRKLDNISMVESLKSVD